MNSTNLNTVPPNRNASGPLASQPKRSSAPSPRTTVEEADVKSQTRPELKRAVRLREYEGGSSTVEAERRNVLRKEILKIEGEREFENEWLSEPAVRVRDFALCAQEQTIESGEETVKEPPAVTAVDDAGLDGRMRNKAR